MFGTRVSALAFALLAAGCVSPVEGPGFAVADGRPAVDSDPTGSSAEPDPAALPAPRFVDATAGSGLDWSASAPLSSTGPERRIVGGGAIAADLDGDDVVDLVLTAVDGPNALFLGRGDGSFERRSGSGLEDGTWTFGGAAADLDGDGLREVLLFDGHQLRSFDNLGGGAFVEGAAPLTVSEAEWVVGAGLVDYDGDGRVDVYVVVEGESAHEGAILGGEDRLLGGLPEGGFEDRTARLGAPPDRIGQGFAVTWLDADLDGDLDAYVINEKGLELVPNRLFLQDDGWFEEASDQLGLALAVDGMGVAQGDLGHDGSPELAVTDTDGRLHMLSVVDGVCVAITGSVEAAPSPGPEFFASWATQMEDFDNDGESDLLTAWGQFNDTEGVEPGRVSLALWRGDVFVDLTPELPELLDPTWRSVLPVDLNGDGQLDWIQTALEGAPAVVLGEPNGGHWLDVRLVGPPGNRDGLGARVGVLSGGVLRQRWLGAGISGAHSSHEPVLHFGLGRVEAIDEVRVTWPDGSRTVVAQPEPDGRVLIHKE